jgi:hypothetical protein
MVETSELLTFPANYPIKVVGRADAGLRERIDAIVLRHAPDWMPSAASERRSANGTFVSISYTIRATSREQVIALATELAACDDVIMVI